MAELSVPTILFLLPTLGGGGAEMHSLRLLNGIDRSKFRPLLATMRAAGDYAGALSDDVRHEVLCSPRVTSSAASCFLAIPALRKLLGRVKPDLVFAPLPHALVLFERACGSREDGPRLVAGVQNNTSIDLAKGRGIARLTWNNGAYRRVLERATRVAVLSSGVAEDLVRWFPGLADKVQTIPNIGWDQSVLRLRDEPLTEIERPSGRLLVACGRLEEQKDYPTLLRAFSLVRRSEDAILWILGRGRLESSLRALCSSLGISESVHFLGFQKNPYKFFKAADLFVLSSAWEGFGNVLIEAMVCGTPVVSTDCPFGPSEILESGGGGRLVPVGDHQLMANAIGELLSNQSVMKDLGGQAVSRAERYGAEVICRDYEQLFADALKNR